MLHISIKAEPIFSVLGLSVTNSLISAFVVLFLTLLLGIFYSSQINRQKKNKLFYLFHFIFSSMYSMFKSVFNEKTDIFFPLIGAFFFFILFQNWFGLLPGVGSVLIGTVEHGEHVMVPLLRGDNADLNTTLMLGLTSFVMIQFYGLRYLGLSYLKKFIILNDPIGFFTGILELISEFSKIISFAFRLFGNIFAGEVLLAVIAFLIPIVASFPFLMLELFVGFIQALVFAMLTAVFINMAIAKHH